MLTAASSRVVLDWTGLDWTQEDMAGSGRDRRGIKQKRTLTEV